MNMHRSIRFSLAAAVALSLLGVASIAMAQAPQQQVPPPPATPMQAQPQTPSTPAAPTTTTMPSQPAQPMPAPPQASTPPPPPQTSPAPPAEPATPMTAQQQGTSGQFYQGTESSAQYPLPDSNGGTLTVNAGMPKQVQAYGPPPSFKSLDSNHDGRISDTEAQAYPPLDSDFLYASGGGQSVSHGQYEKWVQNQH